MLDVEYIGSGNERRGYRLILMTSTIHDICHATHNNPCYMIEQLSTRYSDYIREYTAKRLPSQISLCRKS